MAAPLVRVSKFLSYVLRHSPERIGLTLDTEGWADCALLLSLSDRVCPDLSQATLQAVVAENDKQRFELSSDGLRIRAVQGHSSGSVARQYASKIPPVVLYHGTADRNLASIRKHGLRPQSRHHVHLSSTLETAQSVGARHGKPVVLRIDTKSMVAAGLKFFQAENGVWLTDNVLPQYIQC